MLSEEVKSLLVNEIPVGMQGKEGKTNLNIVIYTSGSRGDTQPYIALGLHLKSLGHVAYIATEQRMHSLVEEFGLSHRVIGGDPTGFLFEPGAVKILREASMFQLIKLTQAWDKKFNKAVIIESYLPCAEGADVIISAGLTMTGSYSVAEKLNIPWIPVVLGATLPTSAFPLWPLESIAICSCLNKWTYNLAFKMLWTSESKFVNSWREKTLGLPPLKHPRGIADLLEVVQPPCIIACAKKIIGKTGEIPHDYPAYAHFPGFFYVPSTPTEQINPELVSFMEDPARNPMAYKTVYLGFGSMPCENPLEMMTLAIQACTLAQCRAIIVAGWSKFLEDEGAQAVIAPAIARGQLMIIQAAPHDWLFPRVDIICHHCGVGTMAAALRAGKPQIPCPVMLDQPYNARTVLRLGCALEAIPFHKLRAENLSKAIVKIIFDEKRLGEVTQQVSQEIQEESEHALAQAGELILDYTQRFHSK